MDSLNPHEQRTAQDLWEVIPTAKSGQHGYNMNEKKKSTVLAMYARGFEGLFQGLDVCLKYGPQDDLVRRHEWTEFLRQVKSNRGTQVNKQSSWLGGRYSVGLGLRGMHGVIIYDHDCISPERYTLTLNQGPHDTPTKPHPQKQQ